MNKQKLIRELSKIDVQTVQSVTLRTIGLISVFGKMIIDIEFTNETKTSIEIISPVPTDVVKDWLTENNLLDKTLMYEF